MSRRVAAIVVVLAVVGFPAVALRALCVGNSCASRTPAAAAVPFCPLPADLRSEIERGFLYGRSPDVLGATLPPGAVTTSAGVRVPWPSIRAIDTRVPIVFDGPTFPAQPLPDGTGLDQIAPTLEPVLGIVRGHPEVRAGRAVPIAS